MTWQLVNDISFLEFVGKTVSLYQFIFRSILEHHKSAYTNQFHADMLLEPTSTEKWG